MTSHLNEYSESNSEFFTYGIEWALRKDKLFYLVLLIDFIVRLKVNTDLRTLDTRETDILKAPRSHLLDIQSHNCTQNQTRLKYADNCFCEALSNFKLN